MLYTFNNNHEDIGHVPGSAEIGLLEQEQGMYSATPEFCREHGGPITRYILNSIPKQYFDEAAARELYPNIDVRVHRLYPGNYPAYPGWHCDAQYRENYFGQPKPEQTKLSDHLICTVSSAEGEGRQEGVSNTVFLAHPLEIELAAEGKVPMWAKVDKAVEKEAPKEWVMPDGQLTRFDCWTLHRCMPAQRRGCRLFFRMAMWYRPNLGKGQLSRQEMVYVDMKEKGW